MYDNVVLQLLLIIFVKVSATVSNNFLHNHQCIAHHFRSTQYIIVHIQINQPIIVLYLIGSSRPSNTILKSSAGSGIDAVWSVTTGS
jgi:hypothetical protein